MATRIIKRILPKWFKRILRRISYFGWDTVDLLSGARDRLTPPSKLRAEVGSLGRAGRYRAVAEEHLDYFRDLCGLKPNEDVLDVGCGCGRMAALLTRYLGKSATYQGFDVDSTAVQWCTRNISSNHPNFHFQLANVFNKRYNPKGKYKASEYKFPYQNESFDFAFGTSVFTHMLPQDMQNYLSEIARVLKRGGRCLITFFLLNAQSLELIDDRKSALHFNYEFGGYRTTNPNVPEAAVCYHEAFVLDLYERYGLRIRPPIRYGSWCGRLDFLSYQDVIIASREPAIDSLSVQAAE